MAASKTATADVQGVDALFLWVVLALLALGVVMVYSTTIANGRGDSAINFTEVRNHLMHAGIGCIVALTCYQMLQLDWLQAASRWVVLGGLMALGLVLVPDVGVLVNGSRRWLSIGGLRIQPAELIKVATVIYVASFLASGTDRARDLVNGVLPVVMILILTGMLLLAQPDFGSAAVIAMTVAMMLVLSGMRWSLSLVGVFALGAVATALIVVAPYRLQRVTSFLSPWDDPQGTGYQLTHSLIALGRGEWFGVGLGASVQKLQFLPHPDNDFITAIIGEEHGVVGLVVLMVLFALLAWRGFDISRRAIEQQKLFHAGLVQGLVVMLTIQAMIHIGVNLGVLPTKGLTLPLVSNGGTSLVVAGVMIGLILRADRELKADKPGKRGRKAAS
ncbi:putative lipid II flippase FtsW [Gammaproteobacteria bacterium]|nr:putative lipid II flippase FtsW [Gammaproteobacteria bacterium]